MFRLAGDYHSDRALSGCNMRALMDCGPIYTAGTDTSGFPWHDRCRLDPSTQLRLSEFDIS